MSFACFIMSSSHKNDTSNWSVKDSEDYYGLKRWGGSHFSIGSKGFMQVLPFCDQRCISIHDIVKEAAQKGLKLPLTITGS